MIILRKGTKDKFWYEDIDGEKIKDKKTLEYLNNLKIPPMYHDVSIFYIKNPKILFQGYDNAGRLQQIYSPAHCKAACKKKFQSLINFGKVLPKIYADCNKYMLAPKPTKNKIIAIIIKIISLCYFRIGNAKYVKLYNHYGVSTIKKEHVHVMPNKIHIKFIGKKGVLNECILQDNKIINAIKSLLNGKSKNDFIFSYVENKQENLITAVEINNWLRQYDEDLTTKMFRNYDANILLLEHLRKEHSSQDLSPDQLPLPKRKKVISNAMKIVSSYINNTPAICKKAYINPELIEMYLDHPKKFKTLFLKHDSAHSAFISFLKTI